MELAVVRDELIEKPLAIRQLFYCVTAARQRLLAIPSKVGNHFGTREYRCEKWSITCEAKSTRL